MGLTPCANRYTSAIENMATTAKTRRKTVRKDKAVLVRVTVAQKKALAAAAQKAGLGVSSWMLSVAVREIQRADE